ncbi:transposase [Echinicola soli]|uniref:transposase n=1 Tax=Echinicola soli TaxID=2591634 RepID=UPI001AF01C79|nr:transposase [Echinicola soli]
MDNLMEREIRSMVVGRKNLENNRKTGLTTKKLLSMEEPEVEKLFLSGDPSYKDPRYEHFISNLPYYQKELKRKGVTKMLLWEEYRESYPGGYGRSQFCHHLGQQEVARAKPSMVLAHKPAEKLYIDFAGKPICYIDRETGEEIRCQLFVACLPYSDYAFAMAVPSQTIPDFLHALSNSTGPVTAYLPWPGRWMNSGWTRPAISPWSTINTAMALSRTCWKTI